MQNSPQYVKFNSVEMPLFYFEDVVVDLGLTSLSTRCIGHIKIGSTWYKTKHQH